MSRFIAEWQRFATDMRSDRFRLWFIVLIAVGLVAMTVTGLVAPG